MALKDLFRKNADSNLSSNTPTEIPDSDFVLGVREIFNFNDSNDLFVVGRLTGSIQSGERVCITNPGDDERCVFLSTVINIKTTPGTATSTASDCQVGLRLEKGSLYKIRKGSVIYSKGSSADEIHNAYISALGDEFVAHKNLELSDQDLESLSITDCAEIWRLFTWFHTKTLHSDDELSKKKLFDKIDTLVNALCKKILSTEEIFCVYSKATGEPFLFSKTAKHGEGYICSPPNILIFTNAYKDNFEKQFNKDKYEIKNIENGSDKKGIYNFLGSCFYLNGACGVNILSEQTAVTANLLVPPPDYSNIPPQNIPVTNPDLVRWMLLLGQLGKPESEDASTIYKLYFRFMGQEMLRARLLIPMQRDPDFPKADTDGKIVLPKSTTLKFPTLEGKYDRPAVRMYTDWKRLRSVYNEEWDGLIQPVEGMIHSFDCAINLTEHMAVGCYVSLDMFNDMKNF